MKVIVLIKIMKALFVFAFSFYGYCILSEVFAYARHKGSWMRIASEILLFGSVLLQWLVWYFKL